MTKAYWINTFRSISDHDRRHFQAPEVAVGAAAEPGDLRIIEAAR